MNFFPYNFENVTFGSTKPKKYIFENIGKKIHEKDQKIQKNIPHFLKISGPSRELFSLYFQICIFQVLSIQKLHFQKYRENNS